MNLINIDEFENTSQDYEPKKIAGTFNGKYIEYKNESNKSSQSNNVLKRLKHV